MGNTPLPRKRVLGPWGGGGGGGFGNATVAARCCVAVQALEPVATALLFFALLGDHACVQRVQINPLLDAPSQEGRHRSRCLFFAALSLAAMPGPMLHLHLTVAALASDCPCPLTHVSDEFPAQQRTTPSRCSLPSPPLPPLGQPLELKGPASGGYTALQAHDWHL